MFVKDFYEGEPGVCRLCNTPATPTIDTGLNLEEPTGTGAYPRMYVCFGCVDTLVSYRGEWVPQRVHDEAVQRSSELAIALADEQRRAGVMESAIDALRQVDEVYPVEQTEVKQPAKKAAKKKARKKAAAS